PNAEVEVEVSDNYTVKLTCLNSTITIQGFEPDEFPSLPDIVEKETIEISKMLLSNMIKETIFAVAVDEARPILTGALLEVEGKNITMVCLDGYRLALRKGMIDSAHENLKVIIPGKTLSEV